MTNKHEKALNNSLSNLRQSFPSQANRQMGQDSVADLKSAFKGNPPAGSSGSVQQGIEKKSLSGLKPAFQETPKTPPTTPSATGKK